MIWPRSSRLLRAPNLQPPASRTDAVQSARQYVTELGEQIQRDLVEPLNELLAARASVQDVNSLGAWFGSASRICSVLALNHRFLFWKKIRRFATVRNNKTGFLATAELVDAGTLAGHDLGPR